MSVTISFLQKKKIPPVSPLFPGVLFWLSDESLLLLLHSVGFPGIKV